MKREDERWREMLGWEGGYDPKGYGNLEKYVNGFHLRIMKDPKLGERYIESDVNAGGCCERIRPVTGGGWERSYDHTRINKDGGWEGYVSPGKKIDENIETIEDLADYLIKYANARSVDGWIEECQKQGGRP